MLGQPVQVAYAVDDVEAGAARFSATFGAGPFFVVHHPAMACTDRAGTSGLFRHSSAYGQWGPLQVELVAIAGEPHRGLHHVAHLVDSLDAAVVHLAAQGYPVHLDARTERGTRFVFCDARAELGHLVELYEPSPGLRALYQRVSDAASGWDGADPVRPLSL